MSKTPRYTATINDQTFTRNSDRTYTHVVVARDAEGDKFRVVGFCGRRDLAEKLTQQTRELRSVTGYDLKKGRQLGRRTAPVIRNGPLVFRDVTMLPLTDTQA
jgi:hypothetical protein